MPSRNWLDIVVCPGCGGSLLDADSTLVCAKCGASYEIVDDIPLLMRSGTPNTALDVESYSRLASVAPQALVNNHEQFRNALDAVGKKLQGQLLEIGTGTGLLTEAMLRHGHFDRIVTTDVSPAFLRHTRVRLTDFLPNLSFVACDGHVLPLRDGAFDVVLGRSVLHHLLHYRDTVRRVYELLRPGGVAVFFEPVQVGNAIISFMFKIILGVDAATGTIGLTPNEKNIMARALKGMMRFVSAEQTDEVLSKLEDKYIFDIDQLCQLARELGFSSVRYVNVPNVDHTYFSYLSARLRNFGIRPEVAAKVTWLKDAFRDTIGVTSGDRLSAPMGYFVFVRPRVKSKGSTIRGARKAGARTSAIRRSSVRKRR